jgi:predicted nucleic acid-binding protein
VVSYLLDTAVVAHLSKQPVAERLRQIPVSRVHNCTAVMLEVGWSARNAADHRRRVRQLTVGMQWTTMTPEIERRAIEVQSLLAESGRHRSARAADLRSVD